KPWSSVTISVSPPPGGASGLMAGEVGWNESPPSVERWTKLICVDVPHGPDSQMLPSRSTWIIGSPSVRTGSATVLGPKAMPPVFWVQTVAGTSIVRKKWSHRTLSGSAAGGHASGTGVDIT